RIRREPINAYGIVENILREMSHLIAEDKQIQLMNKIPKDLPEINSDPNKFTQIIYNLVNNSIKYTESGAITIDGNLKGDQIEFTVKDAGIGLKEEEKSEVFKVFYINDKNTENTGMGLGLPITKHLVELLGGQISVASTYGQGTSIRF